MPEAKPRGTAVRQKARRLIPAKAGPTARTGEEPTDEDDLEAVGVVKSGEASELPRSKQPAAHRSAEDPGSETAPETVNHEGARRVAHPGGQKDADRRDLSMR